MLEDILKTALFSLVGTAGLSNVIERSMNKRNTEVIEPIDKVSIIMPSYNEETFIGTAASSIRNQSIIQRYPQHFEFILADSCSTDNTIEFAKPYVDKIMIVPRGKLTARNDATIQASGNIIVSTDADSYYPYHWLNTLLEPFNNINNINNQNVIGVSGSTFDYTVPNIPGQIYIVADTLYNSILNRNRMVGRNSAFYKHAFYMTGKFNENINQFNIWDIFHEEEKMFGDRLSRLGKIIYKLNASCYHLGGMKSLHRLIKNKEMQNKYQFGIDRF